MTSTDTDRSQLVSDAYTVIMEGMEGMGGSFGISETYTKVRKEQVARGLETFSEATLRSIIGMRTAPEFKLHCETIESAISGEDFSDEAFITDYLGLAHCFTEEDGTDRLVQAVLVFEALEYYDGLTPQESDFSCPQQRVDQCTAIINVVRHLVEACNDGTIDDDLVDVEQFRGNRHMRFSYIVGECSDSTLHIINNESLRRLLTAHDTDLDNVVSAITERNMTNVDDIIGIVATQAASPVRAISSGVL